MNWNNTDGIDDMKKHVRFNAYNTTVYIKEFDIYIPLLTAPSDTFTLQSILKLISTR